ncbi:hypothetical protein [Halodesulfovibrio marinisediminis]|uniref:Uncharacterized protein n=1 Tax=Halodesulfovibrio marinisediminis DSM 17456 TaxID=1121457 RepID=A0A1N6GUM5_9BACT|nr:hypothetical protein [Halodesulfovibrio marinisediminis]SIO11223.1 hypothetical protein SAMN02745161_1811 [Halodesulfovibrio marinisediminis DSM 17456]
MTSRITLLAFALVLVTATFASAMTEVIVVEETAVVTTQPMTMDSKASFLNAMRGTGYLPPTMMFTPVYSPQGLRVVRTERMGMHPRMSGCAQLNMRARYQNAPYEAVYTNQNGCLVMCKVPAKIRNAPVMMHLGPNMHPRMMSPQQTNPMIRGVMRP